jgi:hypothetical protein
VNTKELKGLLAMEGDFKWLGSFFRGRSEVIRANFLQISKGGINMNAKSSLSIP